MDATWAWTLLGVGVGAGSAAYLIHLVQQTRPPAPATTLESHWSLGELDQPTVVAQDVDDAAALGDPSGPQAVARLVASSHVAPALLARVPTRRVAKVPAQFAVDAAGRRALLFPAGLQPGALAVRTSDPAIAGRLAQEAALLWDSGQSYAEAQSVARLDLQDGATVETTGRVQDVVAYRSRFLLRLEDQGQSVGVLVDRDASSLRGERVQVRGRVVRSGSGYAAIEATDVRRIR